MKFNFTLKHFAFHINKQNTTNITHFLIIITLSLQIYLVLTV